MAKIVRPRPEEPHPDPRHWDEIRQKVLNRDGHRCRLCGDDDELHVHHLTYKNWGNEKKKDLTTLCKEHHKLFHRQNKKLKKKTPECPKCNDIYDVVLTDQSGFFKCTYNDCCHYFNDLGDIVSTYKEQDEEEGEEEYQYGGEADNDDYSCGDESEEPEHLIACLDCGSYSSCSCGEVEEDEGYREYRDEYHDNRNDPYYHNG